MNSSPLLEVATSPFIRVAWATSFETVRSRWSLPISGANDSGMLRKLRHLAYSLGDSMVLCCG